MREKQGDTTGPNIFVHKPHFGEKKARWREVGEKQERNKAKYA